MIKNYCILLALSVASFHAYSATIDGSVSVGEYQWSTDGSEGSDKWTTFSRGGSANQEYNDASGGNKWDINYLGTSISAGQFQFGAIGGQILSGRQTGSSYLTGEGIFLSDFALGFNTSSNPTVDSSGFQYAIRLMDVDDATGIANFNLLSGGTWEEANIYNDKYTKHKTATYKMSGATTSQLFSGRWGFAGNDSDNNMLEASFDLEWLSLFDLDKGGRLSTYLTMACVNDEALVHEEVSPVPIPAAIWLLSPVLIGLMGFRRRTQA